MAVAGYPLTTAPTFLLLRYFLTPSHNLLPSSSLSSNFYSSTVQPRYNSSVTVLTGSTVYLLPSLPHHNIRVRDGRLPLISEKSRQKKRDGKKRIKLKRVFCILIVSFDPSLPLPRAPSQDQLQTFIIPFLPIFSICVGLCLLASVCLCVL